MNIVDSRCGLSCTGWKNVLLTSAGFYDDDNDYSPRTAIIDRFAAMLGKPFSEAKVLFIPTAALGPDGPGQDYADWCRKELLSLGVPTENIVTHDIEDSMSEQDAMTFDAIYLIGGDTWYLSKRAKQTGFDEIIKKMVYANKVYVGISAGSMLAMAHFNVDGLSEPDPMDFAGLALICAYFTVHCEPGTPNRTDLPLPHISLTDNQALAVSWQGYELIEG
jgi:peptidase E